MFPSIVDVKLLTNFVFSMQELKDVLLDSEER